jgi:glucose/arabinose dehydrogenase
MLKILLKVKTFWTREKANKAKKFAVVFIGVIILLSAIGWRTAQPQAALPPNFTDTLVANVGSPTALTFTPDNRMLVTTQGGTLQVYQGSTFLGTALNLSSVICSNSERGLLGVAVDPNFSTNHYIYLYYTFRKFSSCPSNSSTSPVNRISRFTLPDNNTINPASEVVLVDNIPAPNGNHNAGDLHFGQDGYLYISVGDGGCDYNPPESTECGGNNDAARDQHILLGKILRITPDGGIPPTNPFQGSDSARCNVTGRTDPGKKCQETFAWGLRNPFRFAFRPGTNQFYINDVGQGTWEEIDEGLSGADYGWNVREGHCANGSTTNCGAPPAGMTNPIYDYGRGGGCASITGGAFVPVGLWPAPYSGAYLFSDYVCGKIFRLVPNGSGGFSTVDFATGLGNSSAVAMIFGPHNATQALYYTTYAGGGQVRRITYLTTNTPPNAVASANPNYGAVPLGVTFSAAGSSDPDDDYPLTYFWNFGDGSTPISTTNTTTSHTYNVSGVYTATLNAQDNRGAVSTPATVRVYAGDTPPVPAILSPTTSTRFSVGQVLTLQGQATDAEDGPIPNSALTWEVILHHVDYTNPGTAHTHPYFGPASGNNLPFTAPAPEDPIAAALSFLEIRLTATDSWGLGATITQTLQPRRVNVRFITQPPNLYLIANGLTLTTTQTLISWEGYPLNMVAPIQVDNQGQGWAFYAWSDGGAMAHTIITPASAVTYTATFTPATPMWFPAIHKQN